MHVYRQKISSSGFETEIELAHNKFVDATDRIGITFVDPEDQSSE